MNRLILVGNGFDLAHGLKTSYKDFIDDFWKNQIDELQNFIDKNFENSYFKIDHIQADFKEFTVTNYNELKEFLKHSSRTISFKNNFLGVISNKTTETNWVDIENEYYNELKNVSDTGYNVDKLNKEFEEIKNLLVFYLRTIDKTIKKNDEIFHKIFKRLYIKDFDEKIQRKVLNKISLILKSDLSNYEDEGGNLSLETTNLQKLFLDYSNDAEEIAENISFLKNKVDNLYTRSSIEIFELNINNLLFLNFNYTDITYLYKIPRHLVNEIHVHGELNNNENPIIFGFGDDVDKKYQEFEDLNDNRYLENFKSIAYLQTDNYKKLLEFIDSEEYQVFIFGHSCGISDRTMLNTIFEHDNCKSIKPFYHKREDGTDNYTEIVQNISRNFNDKRKYRDRVVNKTYCEPLT